MTNRITPRAGTSHEPRSGEQAQPRASDSSRRQRDENQMLDYPTPKAAGGGKKMFTSSLLSTEGRLHRHNSTKKQS